MAAREQMGTAIPQSTVDRIAAGFQSVMTGAGRVFQRAGESVRYLLSGVGPETWMGPAQPLRPSHQETAGRQFDYQFGVNLQFQPRQEQGGGISFAHLRGLADSYDLLRLAIETRKDQIEGIPWDIIPLDAKADPAPLAMEIKRVKDFLRYPDREHSWDQWLRMAMEEVLVTDAWCVYPRLTRGGGLYSLDLVDGATIKRVIDEEGRTPTPPDPAYQQVIKGIPTADFTRDDLLYRMRNPRVHRLYGYSPVEQVIVTVNIAMRRQLHQLNYYTEGNVPEAIAGVPAAWTMEQIKQFQIWWDSLMEGNLSQRRHMKFIPQMDGIVFPKEALLKDEYDEWLARIICYAFSIAPTALIRQVNRASGQQIAQTAKEEGLLPLLNWLATQMTYIVNRSLGAPLLQFQWNYEKITDPSVRATVHSTYISSQVMTPDEVREEIGLLPMTPEQRAAAWPQIDPLTGMPVTPGAQPGDDAVTAAFREVAGGGGGPAAPSAAPSGAAAAPSDAVVAAFRSAAKVHRATAGPGVVVVRPEVHLGDTMIRVMPPDTPDVHVTVNGSDVQRGTVPPVKQPLVEKHLRRVRGHRDKVTGELVAEVEDRIVRKEVP